MRKLVVLCLVSFSASAQQVNVQVELPSISFSTQPVLVEVAPGVQVVPDSDDEVYFVDNYYWHHRGPNWYRTREHTGGWLLVEPRLVPRTIVTYEPGRYRRWHDDRHELKREVHEERKEGREEKHEVKKHEKHKGH